MIPGGAVILDFLIWLRSPSHSHYFFTFVGSGWPIRRWRDSDLGIAIASWHKRWGKVAWAVSRWEGERRRTRRPPRGRTGAADEGWGGHGGTRGEQRAGSEEGCGEGGGDDFFFVADRG